MYTLKNSEFSSLEWIENYFWIVDKKRQRVPFILNPIQVKLFQNFEKFNLILKSRKPGVSSLILAFWLTACITEENTRAVVISHEREATERLLDRVKFYLNNMSIRPKLSSESRTELRFTETNSSFWIGTAGQRAFGRGDDITHLHCSEYDWWEGPEILDGVLEACVPEAWRCIETTANGYNSPFHQKWKTPKLWKKHFFGWHEDLTNILGPVPKDFSLTSEEKKLMEKYNLTIPQLYWRRNKIDTMHDSRKFPQEYPIDEMEAFLLSGKCRFDSNRLRIYSENVKSPIACGYLVREKGYLKFIPDENGPLKIWEKPKEYTVYTLGADVAEGLGLNKCAGVVYSPDRRIVATLREDITPNEFGRELCKLGEYYNWAYILVERNNCGLATLVVLQDVEEYPNLHFHTHIDRANNKQTEKVGFLTNEDTRTTILSFLNDVLKDGSWGCYSTEVLIEMMGFIINKHGKAEAQSGGTDDMVMAAAIGNFGLRFSKNMEIGRKNTQFSFHRKSY